MAYFLKKTNRKKGLYLQIYFSYRDPDTKLPKNKCHKTIGFFDDLLKSGIKNPIEYCQNQVDELNDLYRAERQNRKIKEISAVSPERCLGDFPVRSILRRLDIKDDIDRFSASRKFQFSVYDCLTDLICARLIYPASKRKTYEEVIPRLWSGKEYSYDQILSCLEFIGNDYEKFVEMFTRHTDETYILDSTKTYFDCTNYFFEIDSEDEWRRKGPSKENRKDPIIGMGLLLDANCIPVSMRLYPGNQSEQPIMRQALLDLKKQHNLQGRTITVADKGLNCARNIYEALKEKDGYIFSKSIKKLNDKEKTWVLKDEGFIEVLDKDDNVKFKIKSCVDVFPYKWTNENGRVYNFQVKEKRIVTFNPSLARKQRIEVNKMANKARACCLYDAKKSEYGESAKFVDFKSVDESGKATDQKAVAQVNEEKVKEALSYCGYNMIVTSEINMDEMEIYHVYHQLWRIEESFRTLKSELDARPVYLQTIEKIKGHFLVCYLGVLLERLFQFKALENQFGSHQVYEFIRGFKVTPYSNKEHLNISINSDVFQFIQKKYLLPVCNYYLTTAQIKKILGKSL